MEEAVKTSQQQWLTAGHSNTGNVRSINEDNLLLRPEIGLWAVADGMGGHHGGEIASRMVVEGLATLPETKRSLGAFINQVEDALLTTNTLLRQMSQEQFSSRTIGSTVICMITDQRHIGYLWAGDSRLYRLRRGRLTQLSEDHSEIQRLLDEGLIRVEDVDDHPSSNVVTRAIGGHDQLSIQVGLDEVEKGDVYLLCSDGLYRDISHAEISDTLNKNKHPQAASDALLDLALSRSGADNITLIITKAVLE